MKLVELIVHWDPYLASSKTIATIEMNAHKHTNDNLIDVENAMMIPSATVDNDCKITLNGNPTAYQTPNYSQSNRNEEFKWKHRSYILYICCISTQMCSQNSNRIIFIVKPATFLTKHRFEGHQSNEWRLSQWFHLFSYWLWLTEHVASILLPFLPREEFVKLP